MERIAAWFKRVKPILVVILMAVGTLWANAFVLGVLQFTLPSNYPSGAPWVRQWWRLVNFYNNPASLLSPAAFVIPALLMLWRNRPLERAIQVMGVLFAVWCLGMILFRLVGGVPVET